MFLISNPNIISSLTNQTFLTSDFLYANFLYRNEDQILAWGQNEKNLDSLAHIHSSVFHMYMALSVLLCPMVKVRSTCHVRNPYRPIYYSNFYHGHAS